MSAMLVLPVKKESGGVLPYLKDGNGEIMFVGSHYHVNLCVTAINEHDKKDAEIEALKAQVNELRQVAIQLFNGGWDEEHSLAISGQAKEVFNKTPEQCLNSVKSKAVSVAINNHDALIEALECFVDVVTYKYERLRLNPSCEYCSGTVQKHAGDCDYVAAINLLKKIKGESDE